jgi:hypothetical protein
LEGVLSVEPQSYAVVLGTLWIEKLSDGGALDKIFHHQSDGSLLVDHLILVNQLVDEEARDASVPEEELEVAL